MPGRVSRLPVLERIKELSMVVSIVTHNKRPVQKQFTARAYLLAIAGICEHGLRARDEREAAAALRIIAGDAPRLLAQVRA